MTVSAIDRRLARLESAQATQAASVPMPPALIGAYLEAVAIGLGGYPRPPEPASSHRPDSISDGFARGLGYRDRDRDEMEARVSADPDDWRDRMAGAEAAMTARYVTDPGGGDTSRSPEIQIMVGTLKEIARAKAARLPGKPHHWPAEHPRLDLGAQGIRRALGWFGVVTEEQIVEACRCP